MSATAEKTGLDLFLGAVDTLDQLAGEAHALFLQLREHATCLAEMDMAYEVMPRLKWVVKTQVDSVAEDVSGKSGSVFDWDDFREEVKDLKVLVKTAVAS